MARLIAKTACSGLLPIETGTVGMSEMLPEAITLVAPFDGQEKAVSEALKSTIGAAFPAPGRATGKAGARIVWSGLGQALVLGPPADVPGAAISDQSDAWACIVLEGANVPAVLARLCPLDLRESSFKRGHAARTLLGHMTCLILRSGVARYELLVFRSMARTAIHELARAMTSVAAQHETR